MDQLPKSTDKIDETNELITRLDNCLWLKNLVCKIDKITPCPINCSLKDLKWDKEAILERIKSENENVRDLKYSGMFKNREKIKDKVMGMYILSKTLKDKFEYTVIHVVDKDIEKGLPIKGRGGFR